MRKFFRILRRVLLALASVATLAALALVASDWLGKREFERALARYGSDNSHASPAAAQIPDAVNFAAAPIVRALCFADSFDPVVETRLQAAASKKDLLFLNRGDWLHGRRMDLREILKVARRPLPESSTEREAARAILDELESVRADLDALVTAAQTRPETAIDPDRAAQRKWIQLNGLLELNKTVALRSIAKLRLGVPDEAFADCAALLRLSQIAGASPRLINQGMKNQMLRLYALAIFWEGWSNGQWSEAHYREFGRLFAAGETGALLPRAVLGEASYFPTFLASLPLVSRQGPRGLIAFKLARVLDQYREVAATISAGGNRIDPDRLRVVQPPSAIRGAFAIDWETVLSNMSFSESMRRLAQTTAALEIHRLQTGEYPSSLAEIDSALPAGTPLDPLSGEPPRYRRESVPGAAGFTLYFCGWNQRDEAGKPLEWSNYGRVALLKSGDWVWPQPNRN